MLPLVQYSDSSSQEDFPDEGTVRGSGFGLLPCVRLSQQPDRGTGVDEGGCQASTAEPAGVEASDSSPAHSSAAINPSAKPSADGPRPK